MRRTVSVVLLFLAAASAVPAEPATWPQWRGPTRDGVVPGPDWPETFQGDALQPLWRIDLGPSYSGPVVAPDRVFTTETKDKSVEVVRALDRKTGKELWRAEWTGSLSVPFFAARNGSWIRSTPAYDGESLYVAGMRDVLICLAAKDGKERWRVDFTERYKSALPAFGFVSSPLVDGDAVYVQAGASFLKLNKKTGETIWRTLKDEGGMMDSAFSSPVFGTLHGKTQLLVQTRTQLAGVDPLKGAVLWSKEIKAFRGMNILTPVVHENGVFTAAYGAKAVLLKIEKDGDQFQTNELWTNKLQGYMCSPVLHAGHAYLLQRGRNDRKQPLTCVDLKTGEVRWTSDEDFGEYASLVVQKDRILALDNLGTLRLIKATPEKFVLLDTRKISEAETWAHVAVCGEELFVREQNALAAFRWVKAKK